jgi:hypothetical protein
VTEPNPSVHLDPATMRIVWGALVAFFTTMITALGVIATVAVKARAWFLRSERAIKTDDIVHGVGRTLEPTKDALGLHEDVTQLKDMITKTSGRCRNIEIHAGLPDMSDNQALAKLALERLDTGQHKAVVLADEERRRSISPSPTDTRWRGRPK